MGKMSKPESKYVQHLQHRHLSKEDEKKITDEVADKYGLKGNARKLLHGIRHVENGKQGREFGVLHPAAERYAHDPDPEKSFRTQAEWAAGSIKKHYDGTNLEEFSHRYAPIKGATNDVHKLNQNWLPNMRAYMEASDGFNGN